MKNNLIAFIHYTVEYMVYKCVIWDTAEVSMRNRRANPGNMEISHNRQMPSTQLRTKPKTALNG